MVTVERRGTPFQIAELVEQEKAMVAGAAALPIVGRSFLVAVGANRRWNIHAARKPWDFRLWLQADMGGAEAPQFPNPPQANFLFTRSRQASKF